MQENDIDVSDHKKGAASASASGTVKLHDLDDVVIAKRALGKDDLVETEHGSVALPFDVGAGHKVAIRAREVGEPVHRYGQIIGVASAPIQPGDHVHRHNLRAGNIERSYQASVDVAPVAYYPPEAMRYFDGYVRPDGRVGTRNYVAIVSTVNCAATVCRLAREKFRDVTRDYPNIDGVIALTHQSGCGHVIDGEAHQVLQRVLAGYALHPNVAAYIVVGLGCEMNQASELVRQQRLSLFGDATLAPVVITIQQQGGINKAVGAAVTELRRMLPRANDVRRTRRPASDLILATNCGGSDGYSGITANPALGWAADELVRYGGTVVLGETTEIYGAEQLLVRRAVNAEVAEKLLQRVEWWRQHLRARNAELDHNPSPGNMAGGITTVIEKALGGVAKAGTSPLVDVVEYGKRVTAKGLVYMDTPAYDPVSVTGMVAGGANALCFTTGRGSVYGCKPVPGLKLATNSAMYQLMEDDMDVDCGVILHGATVAQTGRYIFDQVLAVASGKKTKSEIQGIGDEEFAPWLLGPTL